MTRRPLWLVVALELFAPIGDHFFFLGFLAVLADALNAAAVGLPVSPLRAMRSLLPAAMRLRLAAIAWYKPGSPGFLRGTARAFTWQSLHPGFRQRHPNA